MAMTTRETRDLMNVDSFSQLPFIRPAVKDNRCAIRLFGKEVGSRTNSDSDENLADQRGDQVNNNNKESSSDNTEAIPRKFKRHYCRRTFPTSQALGGHQNAHKRERQHAKCAIAQGSCSFSEAHHVYGLMNYHRSSAWNNMVYNDYPWNNSSSRYNIATTRLYGNADHNQSTMMYNRGSPSTLWRIPSAARVSSAMNRDQWTSSSLTDQQRIHTADDNFLKSLTSSSPRSQGRFVYYDKLKVTNDHEQEHVSLDLHL